MTIKSWLQIKAAVLLILFNWFKTIEHSFKVYVITMFAGVDCQQISEHIQHVCTYMTHSRTNLDVPSSSSIVVLVIAVKEKTENTFQLLPSCYFTYYETINLTNLIVFLKYITYTNLQH